MQDQPQETAKPATSQYLYSKPKPERLREMHAVQLRDEKGYKLWASQRPTGGSGQSGGKLTKEQARQLLFIEQRSKSKSKKSKADRAQVIASVRENMLKPPSPEPAKPLTIQEMRDARLKALGAA